MGECPKSNASADGKALSEAEKPDGQQIESAERSSVDGFANGSSRFQGKGVDFKGKLIGERDVEDARGDELCAEAMRLAKAEIKASGKHKPRILLNVSIEGLKIKDAKTEAILYNFPVSMVSFVSRDTTDWRAFGFIYAMHDCKYKFYGIKTAQSAEKAVLAIHDMFQAAFERSKKEQENQESEEESSTQMEDGVPVATLLDLETTELQTTETVAEQHVPALPDDSWPQQQQNFDPFGDSFTSAQHKQTVSRHLPVGQVVWPGYANALHNLESLQNVGASAPVAAANGSFDNTNPFLQPVTSPSVGVAMTIHGVDPFNIESAQSVLGAIKSPHPSPPPPSPKNFVSKNIVVPESKQITTVDEAISKLVNVDALGQTSSAVSSRKNPFEHILNPPKPPLNALARRSAPPPPPQTRKDALNFDFFD
ncbi:Dab2 protein [Aphelenchoides avenae]|nr:Dab2 protein [Aphelenchus avenae]